MAEIYDLSVIYYSAGVVPFKFFQNTISQLHKAFGRGPFIAVYNKRPNDDRLNHHAFDKLIIADDLPRHHLSIYKQALIGAKAATTKYIAMAEDDALYSPEHFKYRPSPGKFAYNRANWGIYTWNPEVFSWKGRRTLWALICERELFIEAMEERFTKYPDGNVDLGLWAEPGKYERQLGVTVRETEEFWTHPPNIVFSHENALAYNNLGKRKRLGELRATAIPYWGTVQEIMKLYENV